MFSSFWILSISFLCMSQWGLYTAARQRGEMKKAKDYVKHPITMNMSQALIPCGLEIPKSAFTLYLESLWEFHVRWKGFWEGRRQHFKGRVVVLQQFHATEREVAQWQSAPAAEYRRTFDRNVRGKVKPGPLTSGSCSCSHLCRRRAAFVSTCAWTGWQTAGLRARPADCPSLSQPPGNAEGTHSPPPRTLTEQNERRETKTQIPE